ncbi:4-hydroxyphenylacetate 3-monooxygenase oxygenase component HpaH [Cupriavidus necator N-1]|jgi:4-hydroxyphenylacetate 3-monooxygenase|uniref:4-hydroxyphenylacetate 3-monooxygenase oxygenase component HpaH n=1 Tax=Cupriavidus necator (strain ATCC 43291 / DSM 13513 / CCUG 52238 / LMG 8453 / N-1) TaxID=1042878 RepID=F8GQF4_CUPNN|nr:MULTISPECIES: 4-hydroxyphenylacetate 3-hydroxylase N-terminal domain-containing protein [Cupriavidus]AEI79426.1 4-hydroxyphenylacetate 3-monooxygenase oxygenase component HpaH [Cupriavidus necator N-1]KAI3601800.1 4-hydroxyphenylacetate 3-monooxygenase [Cupriavidus necator H850]MDX6010938.1 4-hydroxyphenylacetate 3-hydroxylase N-terminal domain-containing protein [Cupriavidus necator]QUN26409.1 4-hydroxyphenylacetate 3-monooxygenase [Cupriavidus sp. KK10]
MIKTGNQHIVMLRDGREVYLDGKRVTDVTSHPAFRNSIRSYANLYDFQAQPGNVDKMTFQPAGTDRRVSRIWELPTSYNELVERRQMLEAWTELHYGFMGRSPDHVASCISGMYMGIDVFEQADPARAGALRDYYRYARDNDLFLTYVIVNPQANQSKSAHEQEDKYLAVGIVDQDAEGITVRGAKMLATSGIMANEVFCSCIQPLREGDEMYALSFAVPMNTKGLKVMSRKSYEANATSVFDNPLASRFDENDAVLYFDDVKVPWERIFVAGDVGLCARQFHATPAHVYQNYQCQVRLMVKLRFLVGLAHRITEINGTSSFPQVREMLGQLAAEAGMVEAWVYGMEAKGQVGKHGYFVPDRSMLYGSQVVTQQLYGKVLATLRELAGGGMIMLPSSIEDFANPSLAGIIAKTQKSPVCSPEERVKFFKLAWDAVGSEFASRHNQYEMFYAGATFVTKGHAYRTYDWQNASGLVDNMLGSYSLESELAKLPQAA